MKFRVKLLLLVFVSVLFSIVTGFAQTDFDKIQLGPHLDYCFILEGTVDATGGYTILGEQFDSNEERVVKKISAYTADHQFRWEARLPDDYRLARRFSGMDLSAHEDGVSLIAMGLNESKAYARKYSNAGALLAESEAPFISPAAGFFESSVVDKDGGARLLLDNFDNSHELLVFDFDTNDQRSISIQSNSPAQIWLFEAVVLMAIDTRMIAIDRSTLEIINEVRLSSTINARSAVKTESSITYNSFGFFNGSNGYYLFDFDVGSGRVEFNTYSNSNEYEPLFSWGSDSLLVTTASSSTGHSIIDRVVSGGREFSFPFVATGEYLENFVNGPKVYYDDFNDVNTVGSGSVVTNLITGNLGLLCADESTWVNPPKSISSLAILADGSVVGTSNLSNELMHVEKDGTVSVFAEIPSQILTDTPVWIGDLDGSGDMLAVVRRGVLNSEAVTEVQIFDVLSREVIQTHLIEGFFRSVHPLSPRIGAGQVVVVEYFGEGGGASDFNRHSLVYRFGASGDVVESFDASEVMQPQGLFVPLISKIDVNALNEMVMYGFAGNVDTTTREFGRFTAILNSSRIVMNLTNRINVWETLPPVMGYASDNEVVSLIRINNGFQLGVLDPNDFSVFSQMIGPVIDGLSSAIDGRILGDSIYFSFNDTSLGIRSHKIGFVDYLRPVAKVDSLVYDEVDPNERVGLTTKITNHGIALSVQDHYQLASNYVLLEGDGVSSIREGISEVINSLSARSPFTDQIQFACKSSFEKVELISLNGNVIMKLEPTRISDSRYVADVAAGLQSGAYVLRVGVESVLVVKM